MVIHQFFFKRTSLIDFFENIHSFFSIELGISEFEKVDYREFNLEKEFISYLKNYKKFSNNLIKKNFKILKGKITLGLKKYFLNDIKSIFFIDNFLVLNKLNQELFNQEEYKELNDRHNNMYSYAFEIYIDFLKVNSLKNTNNDSIINSPASNLPTEKLVQITDLDLLQKIEPYLKSNRILTAAQIVGEYYKNQYVKMELKDWIKLVNDCLPK